VKVRDDEAGPRSFNLELRISSECELREVDVVTTVSQIENHAVAVLLLFLSSNESRR